MAVARPALPEVKAVAMAWAVAVAVGAERMEEARPWVHAWAEA